MRLETRNYVLPNSDFFHFISQAPMTVRLMHFSDLLMI
jgi:hypothetical protein